MRIHLPLHPHHFAPQPVAGPSSSPIVQLGGDLVILELQGELSWEGEKDGGVVGVLGLDRPDKPTLHLGEHQLLHGKISTLPKPYAVIRRVVGEPGTEAGLAIEGDAEEEESEAEAEVDEDVPLSKRIRSKFSKRKAEHEDENEDEDEPPLFEPDPNIFPSTPGKRHAPHSSSPILPPSSMKDYSSELGFSSPVRDEDEEAEDEEERGERGEVVKKRRKRDGEKERTRHYEVVAVVRKKVVFALRPEPIVTATVLPD